MKDSRLVGLAATLLLTQWACNGSGREPMVDHLSFADELSESDVSADQHSDITTEATDPAICEFASDGTLKGVAIDLSGNECVYSLAEVAAGITFHYRILVEEELHDVASRPLDAGQCDEIGPSGLRTLEKIHGGSQTWCICDSGWCAAPQDGVTLFPGEYADSFDWDGLNWNGPSDTGDPPGDPFPVGQYNLVVRAEGKYGKLQSDFAVTATMQIHLTK